MRRLKVLLLLSLAAAAAAAGDIWDDFSNNLFSDLAPVLALFGERVTNQFMSQSTGWADNIILAMAPLGIITIIISAIRVGGRSWLKAIIGRARENLAAAEVDIMSSTSKEVCEVWNGREIVRTMGSGAVSEFIFLVPKIKKLSDRIDSPDSPDSPDRFDRFDNIEVMTLADSVHKHYTETIIQSGDELRRSNILPTYLFLSDDQKPASEAGQIQAPTYVTAVRDGHDNAPNIALNSYDRTGTGRLYGVAALGAILQLGVIVYAGFVTYHPDLALVYLKDGKRIARYSYPCMAVGTVFLVLGMLVCAHVVESSTEEKTIKVSCSVDIHMVWLQRTKVVSDQVFESVAIFPRKPRDYVTTSHRHSDLNTPHLEQDNTILNRKTTFGVCIALCGFIVQFVGLRALHWSISVVQLGAILAMAGLRAWIRKGLAEPPMHIPLVQGFELEWLATTLGDPDNAEFLKDTAKTVKTKQARNKNDENRKSSNEPPTQEENENSSTQDPPTGDWRIMTGIAYADCTADKLYGPKLVAVASTASTDESSTDESRTDESSKSKNKVQKVMMIRRNLAQLENWRGPASAEALCLAKAIEIAMFYLFDPPTNSSADSRDKPPDHGSSDNIPVSTNMILQLCARWGCSSNLNLPKDNDIDDSIDGIDQVEFRIDSHNGAWKVQADEIEAALSLWLFSVRRDEEVQSTARITGHKNDEWLRAQGPQSRPSLRLLGHSSVRLLRDIWWWMPDEPNRVIEVKCVGEMVQGNQEVQKVQKVQEEGRRPVRHFDFKIHRIVGYNRHDPKERFKEPSSESQYETRDLLVDRFDDDFDIAELKASEDYGIMATTSNVPLAMLYAQDMFSAFMRAAAKHMKGPMKGHAEIRASESTSNASWRLSRLRSDRLSKMAQEIQATGLGSLDDIFLSIIPPLSSEHKLPRADKMVDYFRKEAGHLEEKGRLVEAGDAYIWLLRIAKTLPPSSLLQASAAVMEHLRTVAESIEVRKAQKCSTEDDETETIRKLKINLEEQLTSLDTQHICRLLGLFKSQNRPMDLTLGGKYGPWPVRPRVVGQAPIGPSLFGGKYYELSEEDSPPRMDGQSSLVDARDLYSWTPLHYAASTLYDLDVAHLLGRNADIDARDLLGRTPLHYACSSRPDLRAEAVRTVAALLQGGADVNICSRDGMSPLHYAAWNNHPEVVRMLVEAAASFDNRDVFGNTPFLAAAYRGHSDIIEYLWPEVNKKTRDRNGRTALHLAVVSQNADTVRLLFKKDFDQKSKDRASLRPIELAASIGYGDMVLLLMGNASYQRFNLLRIAIRCNQQAMLKFFLDKGADPNEKDNDGWTPLYSAAEKHSTDMASILLEKGADPNTKNKNGSRPLDSAAKNNLADMVILLLEKGADPNSRSDNGSTPLSSAVENNSMDMAILLLEKGADPNTRTGTSSSPLYLAATNNQMDMMILLLEKGADPDAQDNQGWTPLYWATRNNLTDMAILLLDKGANPNKRTKGSRPLDSAAQNNLTDMMILLLGKGADPNARDNQGWTPLFWVARNNLTDMAILLLEKGTDPYLKNDIGQIALDIAVKFHSLEAAALLREYASKYPSPYYPAVSGWG